MKCFICGTEARSTDVIALPTGGYIRWGHGCACNIPYHELDEAIRTDTLTLAIQPIVPKDDGPVADIYDSPDADLDPHAFYPRS